MRFDDILLTVGEFGRYQWRIYALLCLFQLISPFHLFSLVFMTDDLDHWCKIEEWEQVNCTQWGFNSRLECVQAKKKVGIPSSYIKDKGVVYAECAKYNATDVEFSSFLNLSGYDTLPCDAGWEYDANRKSLNQEFDLVCWSKNLVSVSQSLYFLGDAIGAFFLGVFSDLYGRHRSLFLSLAGTIISGVIVTFSVNIWMFTVLRMIVGGMNRGIITSAFVLGNEFVGPSKRYLAGNIIWMFFSVGYSALALLAYFIRNWRHFQLIISTVPMSLFTLYFIIPESARWLIAKQRHDKAEKIIANVAKVNKSTLPTSLFDEDFIKQGDPKEDGLTEILRRPRLRRYTANLTFQLIVNALVYFGLSLSTNTLGVNIYIAFAISGAVEIPAYLSVTYPIEYWGRRPCYVVYMTGSGVACLATTFIPPGILRAVVGLAGKFFITGSFCIVYLQSSEIYPTPVRNAALGMVSLWARITIILCPFILLLADFWTPLPVLIFGCLSLIAATFSFFLPETQGRPAPETIEEGENLGRKKSTSENKTQEKPSKLSDVKYHAAADQEDDVDI